MPKTRAYTREELQGLRRADLQRLCKTYDIKGANAKSDALIDILADYFVSPAYLAPPKPEAPRFRPPRPPGRLPPPRPLHSIPGKNVKMRATGGISRPRNAPEQVTSEAASAATASSSTSASGSAAPSVVPVATAEVATAERPSSADKPSTMPQRPNEKAVEAVSVNQDVARLKETVATLEKRHDELESKLEARLNYFTQQLEQREAALQLREQQLDLQWAQLRDAWASHPRDAATSSAVASSSKRKLPTPADTAVVFDAKRQRIALLDPASPRTPQPGQLPLPSDSVLAGSANPRTPVSGSAASDATATPEVIRHGPASSQGETPSPAASRRAHFIRPEVPSPHRPEPSDRRSARASQLASKALSTITDSDPDTDHEGPGSAPATTTVFGPALTGEQSTATPPALSPSPSIGGDNFSYTPLPHRGSAFPRRAGNVVMSSPGREYMDVALNGLSHRSPSAVATPGSRTMLGTERYRDTRFGDEPVVPWGTPTVDFGPQTPSH